MQNIDRLKATINNTTTQPGIYQMLNNKDEVLYVGKAKNLKNRLKSYLNLSNLSTRIKRLVNLIDNIKIIITETEKEALLLEANLIKKIKPPYNILLRDDKSFPYIFINHEQNFSQISKHRGKSKLRGKYYGPFATVGSLNYTLKILQKVFLLRSCEDTIFSNRTKPCLLYQIERCSGPCVGIISNNEYKRSVKEAEHFLSGHHSKLQNNLAEKMNIESEKQNYEKAASFRDKIKALTQIQSQQNINIANIKDTDVITIVRESVKSCIQVFIYRSGQNWGNKSFFPKHDKDVSTDEIIDRFIVDFYTKYKPPSEILLNHNLSEKRLISESLMSIHKVNVNFLIPERGKKKDLIDYAIKNTKLSLNTHISESISNEKILNDLSNALGIRNKINRIETYDNSHLFGKNAVGAMIVFNKNGFDKTAYRKFNIDHENITPGDDYGMMRQVLKRRFSERAVKDKKKYINSPQLILIDGGKGHYEVAINVLKELNIKDIRVMSMFKGNGRKAEFDKIIFKNKINFIQKNTSEFFFLQRLRDESHRFAIGAHRNKNKKDIKNSELEPINGLGRARRKNLMNYFGSIQSIKTASSSDLEKVDGISKTMSEKIYNYFNN